MQHFILNQDITGTEIQVDSPELLHQMIKVLRFKKDDECLVLDGKRNKALGRIEVLHKKQASIALSEHEVCEPEPKQLLLAVALSKKPSTFELIVQKATELGVSRIIPLVTQRCQVKELRKVDRLEMIIKEACEQSERCFMPELNAALELDAVFELGFQVFAGDARESDGALAEMDLSGDRVILIGPEGGLTDEELSLIRKKGGKIFGLGKEVLRMETAAIASLSVAQFAVKS